MFRDFLDLDNDIALENNIAIANFLDIDEEIATEGAKEFVVKQKERIKRFIQKVMNFIQKITHKIKAFFLKVAKVDTYTIDKTDYKMATDAIKILTKAQPNFKAKIIIQKGAIAADKGKEKDGYLEAQENVTATIKEATEKAKEASRNVGSPFNNRSGNLLTYRSGSLTSLQGDLTDRQKRLNDSLEVLRKAESAIDDKTQIQARALSAVMDYTTAQVDALATKFSILGKILSASTRPNAKEKVDAKAGGKLKDK